MVSLSLESRLVLEIEGLLRLLSETYFGSPAERAMVNVFGVGGCGMRLQIGIAEGVTLVQQQICCSCWRRLFERTPRANREYKGSGKGGSNRNRNGNRRSNRNRRFLRFAAE